MVSGATERVPKVTFFSSECPQERDIHFKTAKKEEEKRAIGCFKKKKKKVTQKKSLFCREFVQVKSVESVNDGGKTLLANDPERREVLI